MVYNYLQTTAVKNKTSAQLICFSKEQFIMHFSTCHRKVFFLFINIQYSIYSSLLFGQYIKCIINSDIINIYPIIKLYLDYLNTQNMLWLRTQQILKWKRYKRFFLYACYGFITDFTTRKETISNKVGVVFQCFKTTNRGLHQI